ncbi:hypothetical protein CBR_g22036 [Chara braunii]|uniref:DUF4360 domain-containing protein n=1 Tax=Chara braunii TaxID=69332 RepID=A0A388L203_CHABU|nr:hypothetical protein CBR_g22036 [Chara braunii]|eukprot:GBG76288.1 hypothetical protein CBR_g22036 [Chara braunii]
MSNPTKVQRRISSVQTMAMPFFLLLAILLHAAVRGNAQGVPRPVRITAVVAAGTGCRAATARLSPGGRSFNVSFRAFRASTPGSPVNRRKNCQAAVALSYPAGWQVSVSSVTARGAARLSRGVQGAAAVGYYVSGSAGTARALRNIVGPYNRWYTFTSRLSPVIFTPCGAGANINVNVEVRVVPGRAARASGVVSIGRSPTTFALTWKKC